MATVSGSGLKTLNVRDMLNMIGQVSSRVTPNYYTYILCITFSLHDILLQSNPEALYTTMSPVQADVLVSNKVNIPGG